MALAKVFKSIYLGRHPQPSVSQNRAPRRRAYPCATETPPETHGAACASMHSRKSRPKSPVGFCRGNLYGDPSRCFSRCGLPHRRGSRRRRLGAAPARANVLGECGSQYRAAKATNELAGQSWQEFFKACRTRLAEAPAHANVLGECGSQYRAAKATNELADQSWHEFFKACRTRLAEAPAHATVLGECGSQYRAAKATNELAGRSWQDFFKACRTRLSEQNNEAVPAHAQAKPAEIRRPGTASHRDSCARRS